MSKIYTKLLLGLLFVLGMTGITVDVQGQCTNATALPATATAISTTGTTTTVTTSGNRNFQCSSIISGQFYFVGCSSSARTVTVWGTANGTGLIGFGSQTGYTFTSATTGTSMWVDINTTAACGTATTATTAYVCLLPYGVTTPAGVVCAGNTITVTGNGMAAVTNVTFTGGATAVPTAVTATSFNVTIPATAQSGPITLTEAVNAGTYNLTVPTSASLTIQSAISVSSAPSGGAIGSTVIISGINLLGATNVQINGTPATGVTVNSTSITCTVAPGTTGTGNVTFTDGCGNAVTASTYTVVVSTNYYLMTTGSAELLSSWTTDATGATSVSPPADFTTAGQIFNIRNQATPTISAAWTVSGTASGINVGDGVSACNFTVPGGFAYTGSVLGVNANATLTLNNATVPTMTITTSLAPTSTVVFGMSAAASVPATTYGNITFSGSANCTFSGGCTVAGTFTAGSTNTVILNSTTSARTFNINNFVQSAAGTVNPMSAAGVTTVNITGNFNQSAGTMITAPAAVWYMNLNGGGSQTFTSTSLTYTVYSITNNTTVTLGSAWVLRGITGTPLAVNAGSTLVAGTNLVSTTASPVNITVNGTLKTANTAGFTGSTSTTIVSTNNPTITLSGTSTVDYYASGTQTVSARADYGNLNLSTGGTKTLAGATTSGNIAIAASVDLNLNGQTLTTSGAVTGTGTITGSPASNLILNGAAGTLNFTPGSSSLNNLSLGAAGVATLGTALDIYGVLGFTAGGNLNMNAQAVTLKSTVTATARVGNLTGSTLSGATNVTVERYINNPTRAWHLLSAQAVTGAQFISNSWQLGTWMTSGASLLPGFDGTSANGASILIHDQAAISWTTIPVANTNATALSSRQGYMLFVRGDRTCTPANSTVTATVLQANGLLTQGPVNVTVSSTGAGNTLVGNPYASPIDMEKIMAPGGTNTANLDQNYMVWDPSLAAHYGVGGYRSVVRTGINTYNQTPTYLGTPTVTNDPTIQFIHSGSAFFMHATTSDATLAFTEATKATSPTTVYNPIVAARGDQQILTNLLTVQPGNTETLADGIRVIYNDAYKASTADDIIKMGNYSENLSSYRDGKKLIVERRPMITTKDTIFLRMTNTSIRDYRFQIGTIDFVQTDLKAYLEDMYKGSKKEIDLTGTINYVDFSVTSDAASANQDRFRIVFAAAAVPQPQTITTVKATQQGTAIAVEWKASSQYNMKQYEVEKSTDGINYSKVNAQASIGANGSDATYNWLDVNPVIGNNFYRIRSVAVSGEFKITQAVSVFMGKSIPGITVYPNPVTNRNIGLLFSDMEKGIYQLRLVNTAGQVVFTKTVNHTGGSATQTVPLGYGMIKGQYQLEITKPDHSKTTKAIIITE